PELLGRQRLQRPQAGPGRRDRPEIRRVGVQPLAAGRTCKESVLVLLIDQGQVGHQFVKVRRTRASETGLHRNRIDAEDHGTGSLLWYLTKSKKADTRSRG